MFKYNLIFNNNFSAFNKYKNYLKQNSENEIKQHKNII